MIFLSDLLNLLENVSSRLKFRVLFFWVDFYVFKEYFDFFFICFVLKIFYLFWFVIILFDYKYVWCFRIIVNGF